MGKTLKELDVKPGDVVRHEDGRAYEIRRNKRGNLANWDINGRYWGIEVKESTQLYTLISRAADTPKLWRDMTDAEKGALLLAAHEGKVIEWSYGLPWVTARTTATGHIPMWSDTCAYRIRPEPKVETVAIEPWEIATDVASGYRITFNTIHCKPDPASIKMEAL